MIRPVVDRDAGSYESTSAVEPAPVADVVVARSGVGAGDLVIDVACGTGNAALVAAARRARVIGIDGAPRLLEVARERATAEGAQVEWRQGDLLALPAADHAADAVLSVFGVIFARDPGAALREIGRILRPDGRARISAWCGPDRSTRCSPRWGASWRESRRGHRPIAFRGPSATPWLRSPLSPGWLTPPRSVRSLRSGRHRRRPPSMPAAIIPTSSTN
jgi:SAM-dependent methyltransferase